MIHAKVGAKTNRFEVIQIFVNFGFSSAAILDFEKKNGFGTFGVWAMSFRSPWQNLVSIGRTVRELFKLLQISIWRPAAILDCAQWIIDTKFGAHRTNRFEVIHFLVNFSFPLAAILDFEK